MPTRKLMRSKMSKILWNLMFYANNVYDAMQQLTKTLKSAACLTFHKEMKFSFKNKLSLLRLLTVRLKDPIIKHLA